MGRSVSTPSNAATIVYRNFESNDDAFEFRQATDALRDLLAQAYPSLTRDDTWIGREDHAVASNQFAYVTVSEYCGLVAICIVPKDDDYASPGWYNLRDHWIDQIDGTFEKTTAGVFGSNLRRFGTFSNGESVYKSA